MKRLEKNGHSEASLQRFERVEVEVIRCSFHALVITYTVGLSLSLSLDLNRDYSLDTVTVYFDIKDERLTVKMELLLKAAFK